jgi:ADP-glucose pyrophosphorylase
MPICASGAGSIIKGAIIDKNVRIGKNVQVT